MLPRIRIGERSIIEGKKKDKESQIPGFIAWLSAKTLSASCWHRSLGPQVAPRARMTVKLLRYWRNELGNGSSVSSSLLGRERETESVREREEQSIGGRDTEG